MDVINDNIHKEGIFTESMICQVLFNATHTSLAMVKGEQKGNLKRKLNLWFSTGNLFWKEVKKETAPETLDIYEDLSGYVYEVVKIALSKDNYGEFLKQIKDGNGALHDYEKELT